MQPCIPLTNSGGCVRHRHNIGVPRTWDDLLEVANFLNGTDFNGDNVTDYALCSDLDCYGPWYDGLDWCCTNKQNTALALMASPGALSSFHING